ncbi:hypothetical protein BGW36DRAFT_293888 [Talaromyces proteolyticus]|uniref:Xylanolytic transcriptional activator regulatory domain-containing protein n=1 Tax=Talaromyces proteolyticus TaxID=1131652 RepID=A0AAD4PX55_9EURO|nr:uncharacterized protein BGW36DRAFT_293888 [Talaromyces proteolyticus]KAH8698967.1 hypothetical protein BGW36DRAFT_293888 [Talaromyces proteolyticus]
MSNCFLVHVGEISSLSFLHFLRKTVKAYVGSVSFTDYELYHIMLETEIRQPAGSALDLPTEKIYCLLESYFEATSGILDLFTPHEIESFVSERSLFSMFTIHPNSRREDSAALDLALAIGAQVRGGPEEVEIAMGYFCRARQVAFEDMLMGQTISTVRLFLLMSFYMLGACHRNTASMFLGVAAKAAIILDLHISGSYNGLQEDECWSRRRIWDSIRNFDMLSSFVLGRPRSLPTAWQDLVQPEGCAENEPEQFRTQSTPFCATVKLCNLLEDVTNTLSKENILHVPTAEDLLVRLRQWSHTLPPNIRRFKPVTVSSSPHPSIPSILSETSFLTPADRQLLAGNMHVSCIYYFAVILITRPYLIAYLMSRLRGRAPDDLIRDPEEASDVTIKNNKVSKLAQVCVSAAVYMVDMCQKAKESSFTFGNLCLLKAWIFGAGLVLGFSMFAGEPRKDIETCFENARNILASIATTSPQARLYHDILTSFAEAVTRHRRRVAGEVRRTVQHYMDQILVVEQNPLDSYHETQLNNNWDSNGQPPQFPAANLIENADSNTSGVPDPISDSTKGAHTLLQLAGSFENDEYGDWNDVDMQFADGFIPDTEPFDQLFYTVE